MSFFASKIIFMYFWLLVTLLGFGWAQDVSKDSQEKYSPAPLFRSSWLTSTESPATNATPKHIRRQRAASTTSSSSCLSPQQPANGEYKLDRYFCEDDIAKCSVSEGTALEPGSQLVFTCNPGYRVSGNPDVHCRTRGNWTPIPSCVEVKCESLNSESTTATCTRYGQWIDCDFPVPPETRAEVGCSAGYEKETGFVRTRSGVVDCNIQGKWEPNPIRCVPACGLVATQQKPLAIGATPAKIGDFPWHVSLFVEMNSRATKIKQFICGGTIIQTNLVLTAAHCVYDETTRTVTDAAKLFVITGNIFRDYDSPLHNPKLVRKAAVKNVLVYCSYYGRAGNYNADIALLELQHPFEFTRILLPACLDDSGSNHQFLVPGVYGKVAGFGRTASNPTSGILQTLTVPYVSYDECRTPKQASRSQVLFSSDKFCAGYNNGSAVCEGDSGGGLVFKKGELWYVMGIVSVGLSADTGNGEKTCDKDSYTLYTRVSDYMRWIQRVLFHLDLKQPFPSCNTDSKLSLVASTIATPETTAMRQSRTTIAPSVSPQNNEGERSSTQRSVVPIPEEDNTTTREPLMRRGCGYRNPEDRGFRRTGNVEDKAQFDIFPWRVAIVPKTEYDKRSFMCIGTLIHPRVVISTASCFTRRPDTLQVRTGTWPSRNKEKEPLYQARNIRTLLINKHYNPGSLENNIAMLLLETPLELSNDVNIVCLPQLNEIFDGSQCFTTGFARDENDKVTKWTVERQITVASNEECQAFLQRDPPYGESPITDRSLICGRAYNNTVDNCEIVQAASIVCPLKNDTTRYVDVGVTSVSANCEKPRQITGAYTNLAAFRQWIDDQMVAKNLSTSTYEP